jgi:CHAT domain-containing protein
LARSDAELGLVEELAQLRQEHSWFYNRLYGFRLAGTSEGEPGEAESEVLRAAIETREKSIKRILGRLALAREAEGLETFGSGRVREVFKLPVLAPDTVLLEYGLREDDGAVFVLTSSGLSFKRLPVGARELRRMLKRWQLNLVATGRALAEGAPLTGLNHNARSILQTLYTALIEPAEKYLVGKERLVIVPYGSAHSVPFHALYDGERHLTEYYEVSTSPSIGLLELCARRARTTPGRAAVLAHSNGGRLPEVLTEARTVAQLLGAECYLEQEATRERVIDRANDVGVLHLAAHGEARLDDPTFAHLSLADGHLSAVDVFNLRLDGALVTLSACESGRTAVVGGDELVGLSRGFLFAGASTLIQSLWRVEDGSTARLMQRFYGGLCQGMPAAAALRAAQRSLLDDGACIYTWAPFQLVGHDGRARATEELSEAGC